MPPKRSPPNRLEQFSTTKGEHQLTATLMLEGVGFTHSDMWDGGELQVERRLLPVNWTQMRLEDQAELHLG